MVLDTVLLFITAWQHFLQARLHLWLGGIFFSCPWLSVLEAVVGLNQLQLVPVGRVGLSYP